MNKAEKIANFDPNGVGLTNAGIYGLPFSVEESHYIVLPIEWELSTSYGKGTANGPKAILEASPQIDLYHPDFPELWKEGIAHSDSLAEQKSKGAELAALAEQHIDCLENGQSINQVALDQMNSACSSMNTAVYQASKALLENGKQVILLGGDHSTPFGHIKAIHEKHPEMGILHIDAHMDLRIAYEGFEYSHASIFYNVVSKLGINNITQVAIRDYCEAEINFAKENGINVVTDKDLKQAIFEGQSWKNIVDRIIDHLPKEVYISFDIDGLNPSLCPNTGTPVPGGLSFEQAVYLIEQLAKSGRKIIGADLVEVAPSNDNDWDANLACRLLYQMIGYMHLSSSASDLQDK